ncbi:MAG: TIGR04211 family SH3 domain-containing protein [Gammaproteobacteria bacterium]|nr:TIGR04211 family SH3 domain-containing protein [Gammaproteobacteria bacterium]
MKTPRFLARLALLASSVIACAPLLAAENAFVIDKLLVGIHESEDLTSAIVKVLPTGSKLDVMVRKGEKAKVKDADGIVGWVDAAYLMPEPPAAAQLEQLKRDKEALANRLKTLESGKAKPGDDGGRVDALTNENTDLKSQLSAQKLKTSELESEISTLRKAASAPSGGGDSSMDAELRKANLELTQSLEEAEDKIEALEEQISGNASAGAVTTAASALSPLVGGVFLVLLVASFIGGVYLTDHLNRRRHGGFRV